ncbi:MAG TPA: hypothetical protein VGK67_07765 [Myxococcales bacterium]|jgi:hypothetical protein
MHALILLAALAAQPKAPAPAPTDVPEPLRELMGLPYVNDEVLDENGRWTFFAKPETVADSPGLNCSGFVYAATGRLLHRTLTVAQAKRDRLGDSGPGSKLGEDWDFGWDLLMNLSDGLERRILLPEGPKEAGLDVARTEKGFVADDTAAWKKLLPQIKEGRVYLASIIRQKHGRLEHGHVAFLVRDGAGRVWLYQTLPHGKSHRLNLTSEGGLGRLKGMFGMGVRMFLLEVVPAP